MTETEIDEVDLLLLDLCELLHIMTETEIDEVDLLLLDLCELLLAYRLSASQAVEITSQRIAELYGEMQREPTHDAPAMTQ